MTRTIKRCPACGSTDAHPRGSGHRSSIEQTERYRCPRCSWSGDELEVGESHRSASSPTGLAAKIEALAEEHDGDVPIGGDSE